MYHLQAEDRALPLLNDLALDVFVLVPWGLLIKITPKLCHYEVLHTLQVGN